MVKALRRAADEYFHIVKLIDHDSSRHAASCVTLAMHDLTQTTIELVPDVGEGANPFEEANRHNVRDKIVQAMRALPETERTVLALYYFEDMNLKEIGRQLNLSESRVCQLHSKAISSLKSSLRQSLALEQLAA